MRQQYSFLGAIQALAALLSGMAMVGVVSAQERVAKIGAHPNLNGVWQAVNTANWNLEGHSAAAIEEFWQLGALFAIPAGQSVVEGGAIPYRPEALAQREQNRAEWPLADPETRCYRAGIPRQTYMPHAFQIVQGDGDMLFVYEYATSNRTIRMSNHLSPDEVLVDQYLGWSNGRWDGDTLVVEVFGQQPSWLDRAGNFHHGTVTERFTPLGENHILYEATIDDPVNFTRPWTISMPLYRKIEPHAEIFEYKCVEFVEPLLYGDLLKEPIR